MTLKQATTLLNTSRIDWTQPQTWCDLGCGEGKLTVALASLLPPGSLIHALDINLSILEKVPEVHNGVSIRKVANVPAAPLWQPLPSR